MSLHVIRECHSSQPKHSPKIFYLFVGMQPPTSSPETFSRENKSYSQIKSLLPGVLTYFPLSVPRCIISLSYFMVKLLQLPLFSLVNWTTRKYNTELGSTMEELISIHKISGFIKKNTPLSLRDLTNDNIVKPRRKEEGYQ